MSFKIRFLPPCVSVYIHSYTCTLCGWKIEAVSSLCRSIVLVDCVLYCQVAMKRKKIPPKWIFELQFNWNCNYLPVIAMIAWWDVYINGEKDAFKAFNNSISTFHLFPYNCLFISLFQIRTKSLKKKIQLHFEWRLKYWWNIREK